jgi:hypothetical protein
MTDDSRRAQVSVGASPCPVAVPVAIASPVTALISQSQLPDCQVFRFVGYFSEVSLPTALCPNRPIISATYLKDKCFYSRATDCCLRKLPVTEQVPYTLQRTEGTVPRGAGRYASDKREHPCPVLLSATGGVSTWLEAQAQAQRLRSSSALRQPFEPRPRATGCAASPCMLKKCPTSL